MKGFVCHVDKKAVNGFQQEQNRIMIRFHKDYSCWQSGGWITESEPKGKKRSSPVVKVEKREQGLK